MLTISYRNLLNKLLSLKVYFAHKVPFVLKINFAKQKDIYSSCMHSSPGKGLTLLHLC